MAYYAYRVRRKTSSGYDIFHIESRSTMILRYDDAGTENGTVEEALQGIEDTLNALTGGGATSGLDVTKKIDKVDAAVENNFPALTADGTLIDSGVNKDTFAEKAHTHQNTDVLFGETEKGFVAVSDAEGKLAASEISTEILGYLSGATSNIQEQIDKKSSVNISFSATEPTDQAENDLWFEEVT